MRCRNLAIALSLSAAAAALTAAPLALAQAPPSWSTVPAAQEQPAAWPGGSSPPPATAAPAPKKAKKKAPPPPEPDPDPAPASDDPPPDGAPPAPPPAPKPAAVLNIRCDGPFAKDTTHAKLAKVFGARNAVSPANSGATTVLFPNDPKKRLEITWRDAATRSRPASISIEAKSTWRARGFRIGETLAAVEKGNGKPFKLSGFADGGGNARDWKGGKLDQLSGGCILGMRFVPDGKSSADARLKVASGELSSDSPDVRAVKPAIAELIVGYSE